MSGGLLRKGQDRADVDSSNTMDLAQLLITPLRISLRLDERSSRFDSSASEGPLPTACHH